MKDFFWLSELEGESETPITATGKKLTPQQELATLFSALATPRGAGKDDNNKVEVKNNSIYFYSEVTRPKILELNRSIYEVGNNLINQANLLAMPDSAPLKLHINSYGGSVFAGFSTMDYIQDSIVPVTTIVEGCAASAATLISVVGHHRQIRKNSFMLIHQLSSGMWGKYEEMKDAMENNNQFMRLIKDIYAEHTKLPKKKINEILKHDLWFDAETCLDYGLVDEII
tara:strand:+ start:166 stop:849 length:684 start_codon:yes stop_codon:yes gene_type:complete